MDRAFFRAHTAQQAHSEHGRFQLSCDACADAHELLLALRPHLEAGRLDLRAAPRWAGNLLCALRAGGPLLRRIAMPGQLCLLVHLRRLRADAQGEHAGGDAACLPVPGARAAVVPARLVHHARLLRDHRFVRRAGRSCGPMSMSMSMCSLLGVW